MTRHPPDILITTPESLYLMLTSRAREIFARRRGRDRRRDPRRRADQARRAHGDHARAAGPGGRRADVQRIGLSATQNPLEEVGRFMVGPKRTCRVVDAGVRKPLDLKIHVPVESMVEPEQSRRRARSVRRRRGDPQVDLARDLPARSSSSSSSTVDDRVRQQPPRRRAARAAAQRAASRPTDGPPVEIARAHHGSLAREERLVIEDQLKAGELPCLVATSSLELGIDMGAVDLVLQVESPKSVTRGLQRIGRAGHNVGDISKGRIFPKFRADLLECAVVAQRMREGADRDDRRPAQPARRARAADRRDGGGADDEDQPLLVDDLHALLAPHPLLRGAARARSSRTCSTCSTAATRARSSASCGRASCGTAWRGRSAPARARARWRSPTPARSPTAGCSRQPPGRPPRRRARRGDGLRGAPGPDVPARRVDLADRGDHARPRDRHARAGRRRARCRSGAATPSAARASSARRSARSRAGPSTRTPRRSRRDYDLDELAAQNLLDVPARAAGRHARRPERPHDRRSSASATRSATGALCILSPVRRPRARRLGARAERPHPRASTASSPTRSGPTTGSSSTSPTPTSRPARTSC